MNNPPPPLQAKERIDVLLEEYRALYGLVSFRMSSLDRRLPMTTAAVTALLTGMVIVPADAQPPLLVAVPIALVWLLRNTINHARSLEDLLRRIEEIERAVHRIAGEELLSFQSSHPSRHKAIGGRTGQETVRTVLATCVLLLGACLHLASQVVQPSPEIVNAYAAYLLTVSAVLLSLARRYTSYGYRGLVRGEDGRSMTVVR
ncbi:MAG: hypothetical protein ACKVW3_11430 [Phycisphaerales bacterium]